MCNEALQDSAFHELRRPGLAEVSVGVIVTAIISFGIGSQIHTLGFDRVTYGLILVGWSGMACLVGFATAWRVRKLPLAAFGVQSTSRRWLLIGVGAGVVAFLAKGAAVLAFTALTGIGAVSAVSLGTAVERGGTMTAASG